MANDPKFNSVGTGLYDLDYFSGSQAQIYIGDVFVDEITSFQCSVQQSKQPIYGYASQLFDKVSKGTVLVQGSFSINFKESGYLWLVLNRYKNLIRTLDDLRLPLSFIGLDAGSTIAPEKGDGFISRANIEQLISGTATKEEKYQFYNDLAGMATANNPNAKDKTFEDICDAFEDAVWGTDPIDVDRMTRRADDNFFDDFDMYLVFGDMTNKSTNHTVKRIRNVHILGSAQSIENTGEPIQEQYSFFARNII